MVGETEMHFPEDLLNMLPRLNRLSNTIMIRQSAYFSRELGARIHALRFCPKQCAWYWICTPKERSIGVGLLLIRFP